MKIYILTFFSLAFFNLLSAQKNITYTDRFTINGKVKTPYTFRLNHTDSFTINNLGNIATINHMGQVLSEKKNVKGILLKDVISRSEISAVRPKDLFGFYFILSATDGYQVVLSWNEVFNENSVYIITDIDGKHQDKMDEKINILITKDVGKGHMYIKGLSTIVVNNVK